MTVPLDVTLKDFVVAIVCAVIVAPFLPLFNRPFRALVRLPTRGHGWLTKRLMALGYAQQKLAADSVLTVGYCTYQLAAMLMWLTLGSTLLGATAVLWLADVQAPPLILLSAVGGGCWINVIASFLRISIFYVKHVLPRTK